MSDSIFMNQAIQASQSSVDMGGYPVGAIITLHNEVIATGFSDGKQRADATLHAEIDAIRNASTVLKKRNLNDCILYTSMEPCLMCFSASFWAYIPKIVFACSRAVLAPKHYMGVHNLEDINKQNRRSIELVHIKELESKALKIVTDWEN